MEASHLICLTQSAHLIAFTDGRRNLAGRGVSGKFLKCVPLAERPYRCAPLSLEQVAEILHHHPLYRQVFDPVHSHPVRQPFIFFSPPPCNL
jgi:hypothetical protein